MSVIIKGGSNGNTANADANGNLFVNLPMTANTAGYATMMAENDNGSITGYRTIQGILVSDDRSLAAGLDTPELNYTFNSVAQDSGAWRYYTSTMTATWGVSGLLLNANSDVTTGHGAAVGTWKAFDLLQSAPLEFEIQTLITATFPSNQVIELGMYPFPASVIAPSEGVYYRYSSAGLIGVINFNGTETTTGVLLAAGSVAINNVYNFRIKIASNNVYFYLYTTKNNFGNIEKLIE